jgi:polyhydroxyalkanoate synthesis regulator phasin
MDIERIQKINNLALDLVKKGLAQSQEEAISQAEKIFRIRNDDVHISPAGQIVKPGELENKDKVQNQSSEAESSEIKKQEEDLSQEMIKDILKKNTVFLSSKIREFTERVQELEKEISSLKAKFEMNQYSNQQRSVNNVQAEKSNVETTTTVQDSTNQQAKQPASNGNVSHPRSGNYDGSDVSIEKFFYAGNR